MARARGLAAMAAALVLGSGIGVSAGPAAAQEAARALPSTPINLIKSPTGKVDNLFETIATPTGFLVTYARSVGSAPPFTLFAQRFSSKGKPMGAATKIDGPGIVGDHVEMAALDAKTAVAVWSGGPAGVKVGKLSLTTGKISGVKTIGKSDDHIHDVAVLTNGNIAVVTPQITPLPLPGTYNVMVKTLSKSLGTVKEWQKVASFPMSPWAYIDQTVVSLGKGGMVLYRDQTTNQIKGRVVRKNGALGPTATISVTPFIPFMVTDIAYLEVKAARLTDGKAAVCWVHLTQDGFTRYDVRCRVVSAAGKPIGPELLVTDTSAGSQYSPEVVALPGGRFTVTWVDVQTFFPSVKYRTYAANGKALTGPMLGAEFNLVYAFPPQTEAARLKDGSIVNVINDTQFTPGFLGFGIANPLK